MDLVFSLEHRFDRTPDGCVWTQTNYTYEFWRRDLDVFDHVRVAARVRPVHDAPPGWKRADGERVSFAALPSYRGPWEYARHRPALARALWTAVGVADAVLLRVPSPIAACVEPRLHRAGRPYGLAVVGDPQDVFAPGAVQHPLRPFLRWWCARELGVQCARAPAVTYVTERTLQRRYPASPAACAMHFSDVELPPDAFVAGPRQPAPASGPVTLITVGSLEQLYKAPDVLLEAVALVGRGGPRVHLVFVGDGRHRPELEARASALGLDGQVRFLGQLSSGAAVRAALDAADVFVLPSRTEGLPRALIEAMARALPSIGSAAGGIPELLPADDLVAPGDARALARKIGEVVSDPDRMRRMSARNLAKARDYGQALLETRRTAFNRDLRARTEAWLETQGRGNRFTRTCPGEGAPHVARTGA